MSEYQQFYYKNNRFQQLRGFYFSARFKSVSKAAEYLNLTQPSISLQIQALEREMKVKLFLRSGRGIEMTKEGEVLRDLIAPLIEGIGNLKESFATLIKQKNSSHINIAGNQATLLYLLPRLIKQYTLLYPDIKFKIFSAVGMEGIKKLRQSEVDIIIGPASFPIPDDCVYQPVFFYDPVLITLPDHPLAGKDNVTIEEIMEYHLILPPPHLRTIKSIDEIFTQHNFHQANVKLEFEGWEIIKKYVELEMAITIALSIAIEDDEKLVGTKLNHYFPRSSYGFILRKGQVLAKQVQEFIEVMTCV